MKALALSLLCCGACTRVAYASLIPKLSLTARYIGSATSGGAERAHLGVLGALHWQPAIVASAVPTRYELSPSTWLAPCDLDDLTCFEELGVDEPEVASTDAP